MKIKCISVKGFLLGKVGARKGKLRKTTYNQSLKLGKVYNVYALSVYANEVNYLIYDENEMASWRFADLFEIVDSHLPSCWICNYVGFKPNNLSLIMGYKEIAKQGTHYDGLLNINQNDIDLFMKRKQEIDNIYE